MFSVSQVGAGMEPVALEPRVNNDGEEEGQGGRGSMGGKV